MKIAVSADGPNLESKAGQRVGTSKYFVIVDKETMAFEPVPNPGASSLHGAGVEAIVLVVSKKVDTVLTGYCSPIAMNHLLNNGIEILTGVEGSVSEVVEKYNKGELKEHIGVEHKSESGSSEINRVVLVRSLKRSIRQFVNILPTLSGVVLLIGMFNALVSKELLSSVFSGNAAPDTLWGVCFGSIFAGNPVNSYIIGGELLKYGISLFAVTAIIIAWVTVGLVQMPAEMAALGRRFALVRNIVSFFIAIAISILTVTVLNLTAS